MGVLAVLAIVGGWIQIPHVTDGLDKFLEPTFADSTLHLAQPSNGLLWFGMVLGTVLGLAGIAIAYKLWVLSPEIPGRLDLVVVEALDGVVEREHHDQQVGIGEAGIEGDVEADAADPLPVLRHQLARQRVIDARLDIEQALLR